MWLMLQHKKADDYVVATGESHSVREFVDLAFKEIGAEIQWKGEGAKEVGIIRKVTSDKRRVTSIKKGEVVVEIDPRYFRPTEVDELLGDASKARKVLGWEPRISFDEMISSMVKADLEEASRDQLCKDSGYRVLNYSNE
jgi:GDPmannose 4,6-dehydratase